MDLWFDLSCTIKAVLHPRLQQDTKHQHKDLTYSKFHGAVEYLPADNVILGSSSFIPKTTQEEREHKSQFFSQWIVASYFSAAMESPLTQEVLLGLVEKKENSKQNPLFFRTKEQANATQEEFGWETKWKAHLWRCNGSNPLWQVRFYKYNLSCASPCSSPVLMPMSRNPIRHAALMQGKYILSNMQHSIITSKPFLICYKVLENTPWTG